MTNTGHRRDGENQAIAHAWNEMLGEADESLCQLLAQKVKSTNGSEPQMEEVRAFIQSLQAERAAEDEKSDAHQRLGRWYSINNGKRFYQDSAIQAAIAALNALADTIPAFMETFEQEHLQVLNSRKRATRRWISRRAEDLHDNKRVVSNRCAELSAGWWINNKLGPKELVPVLKLAQAIAQRHNIKLDFELV
jgi:hypothetical protein